MKFILFFVIFLVSSLTVQTFKYKVNLSLSAYNYVQQKTPNVEGKLLTTIYNKNLEKRFDFTFNERNFGENMTLSHYFEYNDDIALITLALVRSDEDSGILEVGPLHVEKLDNLEINIYQQSCKFIDGHSFIFFNKPGFKLE